MFLFFVCMPTATAVFPQSVKNLKTRVSNVDKTTLITDSPPDWATGNFSGTWGISILGIPTIELGGGLKDTSKSVLLAALKGCLQNMISQKLHRYVR